MMPCGLSPGEMNGQDTQNLLLKKKKKIKNLHTNPFLCIVYTTKQKII